MDSQNFENLYSSYEKPVYNYVLRMVKDNQLAEDLTQDIFVKVYQNLAKFRGEAKISTWIYRTATNSYLDHLRTATHKQDTLTDHIFDDNAEDWRLEEAEKVLSIDEQMVESELNNCVREYVNKLPEEYRAVIVLHDFQGFKNREIAEILDCSLDAVKIRLHRARKKFRTVCASNCNLYRDSRDILCCDRMEE
ncbi:MAG: RNA polymerase sigma factor [bacterium]